MYAEKTSVPVDRSQGEIKKILSKYGATAFIFGESPTQAMIQFEMKGRRIKFMLPLPVQGKERNAKNWLMSQDQVNQKTRSRWRALVLALKAKLECVEAGITTLEQEFLAHIVLPDGRTVGSISIPQIDVSYKTGEMPPLLGAGQG